MVLLLLQCEVYGFLNKDQDVPKVNINKGTPPLGNENKKQINQKNLKKQTHSSSYICLIQSRNKYM